MVLTVDLASSDHFPVPKHQPLLTKHIGGGGVGCSLRPRRGRISINFKALSESEDGHFQPKCLKHLKASFPLSRGHSAFLCLLPDPGHAERGAQRAAAPAPAGRQLPFCLGAQPGRAAGDWWGRFRRRGFLKEFDLQNLGNHGYSVAGRGWYLSFP